MRVPRLDGPGHIHRERFVACAAELGQGHHLRRVSRIRAHIHEARHDQSNAGAMDRLGHLLDDHVGALHSDPSGSVAHWLARAAQQAVAADESQRVPIDPWYCSASNPGASCEQWRRCGSQLKRHCVGQHDVLYQLAAEAVLILHLSFSVFAVLGGLALPIYPRLVWLHVPTVLWGCIVIFAGWVCPLTPLENRLRRLAGESGYEGDFIEHYLLPIVYSEGAIGISGEQLAGIFAVWTVAVYAWVWNRRRAAQ